MFNIAGLKHLIQLPSMEIYWDVDHMKPDIKCFLPRGQNRCEFITRREPDTQRYCVEEKPDVKILQPKDEPFPFPSKNTCDITCFSHAERSILGVYAYRRAQKLWLLVLQKRQSMRNQL